MFIKLWNIQVCSSLVLLWYPFHCASSGWLKHKSLPDEAADALLQNYFIGETFFANCSLPNAEEGTIIKWKFYSFPSTYGKQTDVTILQNKIYDEARVITRGESKWEQNSKWASLEITSLLIKDSGRYDCVINNETSAQATWIISVHNVDKMKFVLTSKGQEIHKDLQMDREKGKDEEEYLKIVMKWTSWTGCDGCNGQGERKRFGFCHVEYRGETIHCKSPGIPPISNVVVRTQVEEVEVEVCHDECTGGGGEEQVKLKMYNRIDVVNDQDLIINCMDITTPRAVIRWMKDKTVIRRNDVSFGYEDNKAVYIDRNNKLKLNQIKMVNGGNMRYTCVLNRTWAGIYDVFVEPLPTSETVSLQDKLFWMGVVSGTQFFMFVIVVTLYHAAQLFAAKKAEQASSWMPSGWL